MSYVNDKYHKHVCSIVQEGLRNTKITINNVGDAETPSGSSMCSWSFQVNKLVEKAYVTLATVVYGTHAWWGEKRQRDAGDRVSGEVVQSVVS